MCIASQYHSRNVEELMLILPCSSEKQRSWVRVVALECRQHRHRSLFLRYHDSGALANRIWYWWMIAQLPRKKLALTCSSVPRPPTWVSLTVSMVVHLSDSLREGFCRRVTKVKMVLKCLISLSVIQRALEIDVSARLISVKESQELTFINYI